MKNVFGNTNSLARPHNCRFCSIWERRFQ